MVESRRGRVRALESREHAFSGRPGLWQAGSVAAAVQQYGKQKVSSRDCPKV